MCVLVWLPSNGVMADYSVEQDVENRCCVTTFPPDKGTGVCVEKRKYSFNNPLRKTELRVIL